MLIFILLLFRVIKTKFVLLNFCLLLLFLLAYSLPECLLSAFAAKPCPRAVMRNAIRQYGQRLSGLGSGTAGRTCCSCCRCLWRAVYGAITEEIKIFFPSPLWFKFVFSLWWRFACVNPAPPGCLHKLAPRALWEAGWWSLKGCEFLELEAHCSEMTFSWCSGALGIPNILP